MDPLYDSIGKVPSPICLATEWTRRSNASPGATSTTVEGTAAGASAALPADKPSVKGSSFIASSFEEVDRLRGTGRRGATSAEGGCKGPTAMARAVRARRDGGPRYKARCTGPRRDGRRRHARSE